MKRVEGKGYVMNFKSNGMSGNVLQYLTRVTSSDLQNKIGFLAKKYRFAMKSYWYLLTFSPRSVGDVYRVQVHQFALLEAYLVDDYTIAIYTTNAALPK